MNTIRPNEQRANIAILMVWIVLAMEVISLFSNYFQYDLLNQVSDGNPLLMDDANANDSRVQLIAILYLMVFIVSGITFIMWFRRAYFNLHNRVDFLEYSEGWAAGSWFVPIMSLFRPFKIMKEIYQVLLRILHKKEIKTNVSTQFLGWWWFLWVVNGVIGQMSFRLSMHAETLNELIKSTTIEMIGNVLGIPLAILTVKVIKDASILETEVDLAPEVIAVQEIPQEIEISTATISNE
ncbi:MAG: DUF4328 domain-containing protein [Flavobacterium sp.]|nr:DUF4328 domain-containing protein [Flavobacterium sp.]MBP6100688.1 DUF4328 domain-containing protein [Flavobacterium sp.]